MAAETPSPFAVQYSTFVTTNLTADEKTELDTIIAAPQRTEAQQIRYIVLMSKCETVNIRNEAVQTELKDADYEKLGFKKRPTFNVKQAFDLACAMIDGYGMGNMGSNIIVAVLNYKVDTDLYLIKIVEKTDGTEAPEYTIMEKREVDNKEVETIAEMEKYCDASSNPAIKRLKSALSQGEGVFIKSVCASVAVLLKGMFRENVAAENKISSIELLNAIAPVGDKVVGLGFIYEHTLIKEISIKLKALTNLRAPLAKCIIESYVDSSRDNYALIQSLLNWFLIISCKFTGMGIVRAILSAVAKGRCDIGPFLTYKMDDGRLQELLLFQQMITDLTIKVSDPKPQMRLMLKGMIKDNLYTNFKLEKFPRYISFVAGFTWKITGGNVKPIYATFSNYSYDYLNLGWEYGSILSSNIRVGNDLGGFDSLQPVIPEGTLIEPPPGIPPMSNRKGLATVNTTSNVHMDQDELELLR